MHMFTDVVEGDEPDTFVTDHRSMREKTLAASRGRSSSTCR